MHILQTISAFGAYSGGTSTCTYDLISAMSELKTDVDLLTPEVPDSTDKLMGKGEKWIRTVPYDCITPYGYSKNLYRFLKENTYDLYHTNGIWMYCNHVTCKLARNFHKPYLITPHGMLYAKAIKRSYWKKWPLLHLYFKEDIMKATCIHATCKEEMDNIRLFGYKGPIAIIPNPANLPSYIKDIADEKESYLNANKEFVFGFLGRLHPVKKIENLLYAFANLENKDCCKMVIIGKGDAEYENFLKREVRRLNLPNISFKGFVNGPEKYKLLAKLSALFVPSDFENFGMIVTEALSVKTPVMASLGTPWEQLNIHKCGWWIDHNPQSITEVMNEIQKMSREELLTMGYNGRKLVLQNYTSDIVANQMKLLYEWILKGGNKPNFVYL